MKANELRIGSYVQLGGTQQIQLKEGHLSLVFSNDTYLTKLKPIPLNEEWLLNFGFEKWVDEVYFKEYDLDEYRKCKFRVFERLGHVFIDHNKQIKKNLKYVHSLQNLYFALTGEELTINK